MSADKGQHGYRDEDWDRDTMRENKEQADAIAAALPPYPLKDGAVDPLERLNAAGLRLLATLHGSSADGAYTGQPQ